MKTFITKGDPKDTEVIGRWHDTKVLVEYGVDQNDWPRGDVI